MILNRLNLILNQFKPSIQSITTSITSINRTMSTSTGPELSKTGIDLFTVATPNGIKITMALEELIAGGSSIEYKEHKIDFSKNEQKEPWFLKICPNGRIPAIKDHNRNGQNVWETGSILLYLIKHYDPNHLISFGPNEEEYETDMINWLFFQHGGIGPMMGQAGWFLSSDTKVAFAAKRYINESKRLFSVYETQLEGKDYLVGPGKGKLSLADISAFPWIRAFPYSLGETSLKELGFPLLEQWIERIEKREGTKKAIANDMITNMMKKEDWKETAKGRSAWVWKEEK